MKEEPLVRNVYCMWSTCIPSEEDSSERYLFGVGDDIGGSQAMFLMSQDRVETKYE